MKRILVIMGGPSFEYEISLRSGLMIIKSLINLGWEVYPVILNKNLKWIFPQKAHTDFMQTQKFMKDLPNPLEVNEFLTFLYKNNIYKAFPAMHGKFGEDGCIQGFLKTIGLKFVGNGVKSSAVSMDKLLTKHILTSVGVLTPKFAVIKSMEDIEKTIEQLGLPMVLKVPYEGSSFGLAVVSTKPEVEDFIRDHISKTSVILAEKFVKGREFTCGVLTYGKNEFKALLPTEIIPQVSEYFDFEAKYQDGGSLEITPARISEELTLKIQEIALKVHKTLEMDIISRTDFILSNEQLYVLEVNSMPGFTENSLFPKAAAASGMNFDVLVNHLLKMSFNENS